MENPFIIKSYESKDLFCDREEELQLMFSNCINGTDMTLISQRRIGKTGLMLRLFDELHVIRPEIHTIYLDIFASRNIDDFIKLMAEAAMKSFPSKTSMGEKLLTFIKSLRPQLSFDSITGEPQLQIAYQTAHEKEYTLRGLFEFLDSQNEHIVMAIDEFQQIREYPEQNIEALLRTYIQQTHNLTFIFSGSKKHLMADIFANEKKPFYSSTSFISLGKISEESYSVFIRRLFNERQRNITDEALLFILEWTRRHTYYTQQLCHTVYANGSENVTIDNVKKACEQLMQQGETIYLQYRQMLTDKQWDYLIAVAKEGSVQQITASAFLKNYKIGTPSVSRRLADALCEKGLLNNEVTIDGTTYSVSDVFLSHWMERFS
ncbi:MAG: ATP-binding protein [Prevotella sp.]|nr:ATP-binding protein [Prevotella sp.]